MPEELVALTVGRHELGVLVDVCLEAKRLLHGQALEAAMGVPRAELSAIEDSLYGGYLAMTGTTDPLAGTDDALDEQKLEGAPLKVSVTSQDAAVLETRPRQLRILVSACLETDRLIEDWEFETIMGMSRAELAAVKDDLLAALGQKREPG